MVTTVTLPHRHQLVIVMGVSGCGKSSVGELLAESINAVFYDGDDLHPQNNIKKMTAGVPLTDDDRWPWLDRICEVAAECVAGGQPVVVACSALKKAYRHRLNSGAEPACFVFLSGTRALIARRQSDREGHFMPTALLESQFATLEEPVGEANVITVNIDQSLAQIVDDSISELTTAGLF